MKKLLLPFMLLPFISSCDQVDKDDRYIQVEDRPLERMVLLEEFTGQNCVNCPDAHAVIEKLETQYPENLIVVSIHAGSFGIAAENGGLMQPEGDEYASNWNVSAYPCGVVDRKSGVLNSDSWATAIRTAGASLASADIDISAELSGDGKRIDITTNILPGQAVDANLQLWVVESDIIGYQRYYSERIQDYDHNNVFRATVNGTWGQPVSMGLGQSESFSHSIEVKTDAAAEIDNWNTKNLAIVGFLYNDSGVIAVNKAAVL